jgi:hypothetical protein
MHQLILTCIAHTDRHLKQLRKVKMHAGYPKNVQANNWTEQDRKYLIENLTRTRDLLVAETNKLSEKQWRFKESSDRWSINEVVEHVAIYEVLFCREISQGLAAKPKPELIQSAKPDSTYLNFILESKPHLSTDYSKPFTFSVPMGLNDGKNNLAWFLKLRNESISYITGTQADLRLHAFTPERPNVHQVYIWVFGHLDRALRQIKKVKQHTDYPKK